MYEALSNLDPFSKTNPAPSPHHAGIGVTSRGFPVWGMRHCFRALNYQAENRHSQTVPDILHRLTVLRAAWVMLRGFDDGHLAVQHPCTSRPLVERVFRTAVFESTRQRLSKVTRRYVHARPSVVRFHVCQLGCAYDQQHTLNAQKITMSGDPAASDYSTVPYVVTALTPVCSRRCWDWFCFATTRNERTENKSVTETRAHSSNLESGLLLSCLMVQLSIVWYVSPMSPSGLVAAI